MEMTVEQGSKVLNEVISQATGVKQLGAIDSTNFISVATTALKTIGYEKLTNALSVVMSRTIFSNRPYYRKFKELKVDNIQYGNHVRKINYIDNEFEDDNRYKFESLQDGSSVDMQKIKKPKVVQTNFYGQFAYSDKITIFKNQWDVALSSAEEFARFVSGIYQNIADRIEQAHENTSRFCLANFMNGAKKIDLLEVYNKAKGTSLTADKLLQKENFTDFFQFAYAYIVTESGKMTERTEEYHVKLTGKPIMRHTPTSKQMLYMLSYYNNLIESTVLSSVYHDEYLKKLSFEKVNFWQSFNEPTKLQGKFSVMGANGEVTQTDGSKASEPIFAVIADREALGYTTVNQWTAPAPFNADGGYTNFFWHFTDRYWNDFTENGVVFTLGKAEDK